MAKVLGALRVYWLASQMVVLASVLTQEKSMLLLILTLFRYLAWSIVLIVLAQPLSFPAGTASRKDPGVSCSNEAVLLAVSWLVAK